MLLSLNEQELNKLRNFAKDKVAVEGLKKLFLHSFLGNKQEDTESKAAAYIAIQSLESVFINLANLKPEEKITNDNESVV